MNNQLYGAPVSEIIKSRTSVRTYLDQPLTAEMKAKLVESFPKTTEPFNVTIRFKLIENEAAQSRSPVKLGTYGVIKGAKTFLAAAAAEKKEKNLEQFGYAFEKIVLYATSLGLGTCWLGGTFKKGEFAKAIGLTADEIMPCVSPVGYPGRHKSIIESVMRYTARSDNRKSWDELFFDQDFGHHLEKTDAGIYQEPLEMLRLAPSASNKQPWRVIKENNKYHFYLEHTKGYAKLLAYDLQKVDMGIAMCHFELTAKEAGIDGKWLVCDPGIKVPEDTEYTVSWMEKGK